MRALKTVGIGFAVGAGALALLAASSGGRPASHPTRPTLASQRLAAGTLDPQHLPSVLPRGIFRASTSRVAAPSALPATTTNALITSDLAIYVTDGGSAFTSVAAEGHLSLTSNDGGVHYVGTFVDDLAGAKVFWASATGIQPVGIAGDYRIDTSNGPMSFHVGGTFSSHVPAKYGSGAKIATILYAGHAWTARAPLTVTLGSFTIGGFHPPVSGTLTLTTDALGYIVPYFGLGHVNSTWSYFASGSLHTYFIDSEGRYFPADGAGDGFLTTILGVGHTTIAFVEVKEGTDGQKIISGNGVTGSGASTSLVSVSAK
jgi:hypothetical protein